MLIQPYLFFDGRCEEALKFYQETLGASIVMSMRFKDMASGGPPKHLPPEKHEKIMHACFQIGESKILCSDGNSEGKTKMEGFSLSLEVHTIADADRLFTALSIGGKVQMPIGETFFSKRFGMVADRYFSAQKVLGFLHIGAGISLIAAPFFTDNPKVFLGILFVHMLCYMPTLGLSNSIAFQNIQDQEKHL